MNTKKTFEVISDIFFYIFLIFLLIIFISSVRAKKSGEQPSVFGHSFYCVLSGSMEPTIKTGSLIITKEVSTKDIKINDIITFRNNYTENLTTHRVKGIINDDSIKFITQGDANNIKDPSAIDSNLLVGKVVFFIPLLGLIALFIKSNLLILLAILTVFLLMSKYI